MTARLKSLALALVAPLLLWGCVVTPGKFVSTLTVNADRSFAFTYVGEVYAIDMGKEFTKGMGGSATESDAKETPTALQKIVWQDTAKADAAEEAERKNRAIAEALAKEAGYRKVEYVGGGKFVIDYAASGRLTHNFLFPFNSDAEVIFPFVMIELRGADRVRVKAPAFGESSSGSKSAMGLPDTDSFSSKLDGIFTLTTDAEIVSQNNENGPTTTGVTKVLSWKATPTTKDAPLAVLRLASVP